MFRKGDKVICIHNVDSSLLLNNVYIIKDMDDFFVKLNETGNKIYDGARFISLKEQRKQKLQEICLSQETELN